MLPRGHQVLLLSFEINFLVHCDSIDKCLLKRFLLQSHYEQTSDVDVKEELSEDDCEDESQAVTDAETDDFYRNHPCANNDRNDFCFASIKKKIFRVIKVCFDNQLNSKKNKHEVFKSRSKKFSRGCLLLFLADERKRVHVTT